MGPKNGKMMAKNQIGMTTGSLANALKQMLLVSCIPITFSQTKYNGVHANPNVINCAPNFFFCQLYENPNVKCLRLIFIVIITWWMSMRMTAASRHAFLGRSEKALEWSRRASPNAQYTAEADGSVRVNTYSVANKYMYLNFCGFHIACMISLYYLFFHESSIISIHIKKELANIKRKRFII